MSEEGDPYRNVDVGGGINPFGETIDDLSSSVEAVNSQLTITEQVLVSIANQIGGLSASFEKALKPLESLGKPLEKFKPIAKEMTKSKFGKAAKGLTGMFKSLGLASLQTSAVGALMSTLEPLLELFKPFQVVLDLISSLLQVLVANALQPMFEALQPLFDALISLMPIFAEIGTRIGTLIAAFLVPLVDMIVQLMPAIEPLLTAIVDLIFVAIEPLMTIFLALMPIISPIISIITTLIELAIEPLKTIFDTLMPILLPLIDTIIDLIEMAVEPFEDIMETLMPIILSLVDLALLPLEAILLIVTPILTALTPILTSFGDIMEILSPAIEIAIGWITELIDILLPPEEGELKGEGLADPTSTWLDDFWNYLTYFSYLFGAIAAREEGPPATPPPLDIGAGSHRIGLATGGIAISPTVANLGEGGNPEAVIPLDKWERSISTQTALLGVMHDELVTLNYHNRELVNMKEWKRVFG